ncbi:MAG: EAL domain-containing protein [Steroidobacteraceae bacterium]
MGEGEHSEKNLTAIGREAIAALPDVRIYSLSLHDDQGDILWLSEGAMGPDEHSAVRAAMEAFAGQNAPAMVDYDLGDGRCAALVRVADKADDSLVGLVMFIVDTRNVPRIGSTDRIAPELKASVRSFAGELGVRATQTMKIPAFVLPEKEKAKAGAPRPAGPPVTPALDRYYAALMKVPFALYLQRLLPLTAGSRIRRYEVLLRSKSELAPDVAPHAMLRSAVEKGLGTVIDRRVVVDLITWLRNHPASWQQPLLLSVNLTSTAIADDNFLRFVAMCLEKSKLPKGMLAFEIASEQAYKHPERVAHVARTLSAAGCPIVIDDFEIHEGSDIVLNLRGARMIKLSANLTSPEFRKSKAQQAIIAGIAQMARVTGMHTVAKRVESREDRTWLKALGIDFVQGNAFGTPIPLEQLAAPAAPTAQQG